MNKEQQLKIPVDTLFEGFQSHIGQEKNKRILFSAKFGTGKTYFLNEFFKTHSDEYEVFHLYPVNYQISSNESILEYIRYDLLIQLLDEKRKITFKDEESYGLVDTARALHIFGTDQDNFAELLKIIPKVGQTLSQAGKLYAQFEKSKYLLEKGDKVLIESYLAEVKKLDEVDPQAQLIRKKISTIEDKTKVLVIDDLDRIDPEHIFRILNVFSAHFAQSPSEEDNLFGFDKVILVADVENLRSIFHHRYGEKTDFGGYIDKFYSGEIFKYSISALLEKDLYRYLGYVKTDDYPGSIHSHIKEDNFLTRFLVRLLSELCYSDQYKVTIRVLEKSLFVKNELLSTGKFEHNVYPKDKRFNYILNSLVVTYLWIFSLFLGEGKKVIKSLEDKFTIKGDFYEDYGDEFLSALFEYFYDAWPQANKGSALNPDGKGKKSITINSIYIEYDLDERKIKGTFNKTKLSKEKLLVLMYLKFIEVYIEPKYLHRTS
jgi:hypothetical protein